MTSPTATIDEAWARAEAALPKGTCDLCVYHYDEGPPVDGWATHEDPPKYGARAILFPSEQSVFGYGSSPSAALDALVVALEAA